MKLNYLKYWRVIRYFIKTKYNLTQADLDIILFLHDEDYFSKDKFSEFDRLLSWNINRFDKLLSDGWIEVFRKYDGRKKGLYTLSYKSNRVVTSIYKKLSGEEIPVSPSSNPMFAKNVPYTHKVYRNMIKDMNKVIRQQRYLSQE